MKFQPLKLAWEQKPTKTLRIGLKKISEISTFDSSVGRAGDCRSDANQISLGRWFKSGSKEWFCAKTKNVKDDLRSSYCRETNVSDGRMRNSIEKRSKRRFTSSDDLSVHTFASRDSSVGRASDWRSEGPWFNPGSRHVFKEPKFEPQVMLKRFYVLGIRGITKTPLATVASTFWKLENPGIDPGASRMQIERSTIWAHPPMEDRVEERIITVKKYYDNTPEL